MGIRYGLEILKFGNCNFTEEILKKADDQEVVGFFYLIEICVFHSEFFAFNKIEKCAFLVYLGC